MVSDNRPATEWEARFEPKSSGFGPAAAPIDAIEGMFQVTSKVSSTSTEGRALRTETTVNDTRDFGIGRLLTNENWTALVEIGH